MDTSKTFIYTRETLAHLIHQSERLKPQTSDYLETIQKGKIGASTREQMVN